MNHRAEQPTTDIPRHVGFIMDGNRRWARERGLTSLEGHAAGQTVLHDAVYHAVECGVKYITAYAFSTENWSRSPAEVGYLMKQIVRALKQHYQEFKDNGIRFIVVGSRERLSKVVLTTIDKVEQGTARGTRATLAICFNYSGHTEIADAVRSILEQQISPADVTPKLVEAHLYHPEVPPVDLVIRTSGEQRVSNFMLWRTAYSEFIFRPEYWPDFTPRVLDECLLEYSKRQRRFGG